MMRKSTIKKLVNKALADGPKMKPSKGMKYLKDVPVGGMFETNSGMRGVLIELRSKNEIINLTELRGNLNKLNIGEVQLQTIGSDNDIAIRVQKDSGDDKQLDSIKKIKNALSNIEIEFRRTEYVGPKVGKELIRAGLIAILFSLLGILAYIWLRFEWHFALGAIIALIHDVFFNLNSI